MKTRTRQRESKTRHIAGPGSAGFAFAELLLVLALLSVVSALALRGLPRLRAETMKQEAEILSIFAKEAGEWEALPMGEGGWIWVRRI